MGALASCLCCGRRRKSSDEKDPLLPRHLGPDDDPLPPHDQIQKTAAVLAALSAHKLPSQDQINDIVRVLQRNVLDDHTRLDERTDAYGPLSARGRQVRDDMREACQAILQFGLEKNHDDVLQDFWYHCTQVEDPVRAPPNPKLKKRLQKGQKAFADNAPEASATEVNEDIQDTLTAVRTLASLVLTSTAFRLILSDIFTTSRSVVADFASNVATVAGVVQDQAAEMDETIRPAPPKANGAEDITVEGVDTLDTEAVKNKGEDVKELAEDIPEQLGTGVDGTKAIVPESAERIRNAVLERIRAIIVQAQSDPAYEAALMTIFDVLHKYVDEAAQLSAAANAAVDSAGESSTGKAKGDSLADVAPVTVEMDPELRQAVNTLRTLLNRFGGGVEPIIDAWEQVAHHAYADPAELEKYLLAVSDWLRKAMYTPRWINEPSASRELAQLYDRGQSLLTLDPALQQVLSQLLTEAERFLSELQSDPATNRLSEAFTRLGEHAKALGLTGVRVAMGQRDALAQARKEIWYDVLSWLLPRLLRALRAIPIPRVEYTSELLDLVIDDLVLTAPSFVPDHVFVENSNSVQILASEALEEAGAEAASNVNGVQAPHTVAGRASLPPARTGLFDSQRRVQSNVRVKMDGLRLSARLISYFVDVRFGKLLGLALGWKDSGLLSFDIGERVDSSLPSERAKIPSSTLSEGVSIDLDLRTSSAPDAESFYDVQAVNVHIPGLRVGFSKTRHWLINALLRPFIGPVGEKVASSIASAQLKALLVSGDKLLYRVHERAVENTTLELEAAEDIDPAHAEPITPSLGAYYAALMEIRAEDAEEARKAQEHADALAAVMGEIDPTTTESEIHATAKGLVRTTRVEGPSGLVEEESAMAVGVGPQLLPGRGGPGTVDEGRGIDVVQEEATQAAEEVTSAVEDVTETVKDAAEQGVDVAHRTREELADGAETYQRRKRREREKDGWKSSAFDLL